ncbi:aromatic compound dioxygenase [Schizophyllum commune Loenen D]|nr:aromatic compound dioxygenase [Schizophyllum commune Loenen D]
MHFATLLATISLLGLVAAHPEPKLSLEQMAKREIESRARSVKARTCAPQIRAFEDRRRAKRGTPTKREKRQTSSTSAGGPQVTGISDDAICVTAPEVTEGPYYINDEYVRQDIRETQEGVNVLLDVGILDTETCEPVSNAFVEIWHANSTGVYGGYSGAENAINTETFLRGGYFTNDEGIVELTTTYPGYYQGRTAHIHTRVHLDWSQTESGQLQSSSGSLLHIGQFYFDEDLNDAVFGIAPYTDNTNRRTLNENDGILQGAIRQGDDPYIDVEYLGGDLSSGILGYITLGVDTSAAYSIHNTNALGQGE